MPKVSKVGKLRKTAAIARQQQQEGEEAAAAAAKKQSSSNTAGANAALSRGQRKRQAKRDQYLKRQSLVLSTLILQKRQDEQKKRIDGLDALKESLQVVEREHREVSAADSKTKPSALKTSKSKRALTAREVQHMGLVLEHPSFQSNPFATMQQHLKNTLEKDAQLLQQQTKERQEEERLQREQAKQRKKQQNNENGSKRKKKKGGFKASRKLR